MSSRTVLILVLLVVVAVAGGIFLLQRNEPSNTNTTTNTAGNANVANANAAPTPLFILGTDPAKGSAAGGTIVKVSGSGFESGTKVFFGDDGATVTFKSATELSATTPKHAKGAVGLRVVNPDGKTASFPDAFTFE